MRHPGPHYHPISTCVSDVTATTRLSWTKPIVHLLSPLWVNPRCVVYPRSSATTYSRLSFANPPPTHGGVNAYVWPTFCAAMQYQSVPLPHSSGCTYTTGHLLRCLCQ